VRSQINKQRNTIQDALKWWAIQGKWQSKWMCG
jgi:hypothetical protein